MEKKKITARDDLLRDYHALIKHRVVDTWNLGPPEDRGAPAAVQKRGVKRRRPNDRISFETDEKTWQTLFVEPLPKEKGSPSRKGESPREAKVRGGVRGPRDLVRKELRPLQRQKRKLRLRLQSRHGPEEGPPTSDSEYSSSSDLSSSLSYSGSNRSAALEPLSELEFSVSRSSDSELSPFSDSEWRGTLRRRPRHARGGPASSARGNHGGPPPKIRRVARKEDGGKGARSNGGGGVPAARWKGRKEDQQLEVELAERGPASSSVGGGTRGKGTSSNWKGGSKGFKGSKDHFQGQAGVKGAKNFMGGMMKGDGKKGGAGGSKKGGKGKGGRGKGGRGGGAGARDPREVQDDDDFYSSDDSRR